MVMMLAWSGMAQGADAYQHGWPGEMRGRSILIAELSGDGYGDLVTDRQIGADQVVFDLYLGTVAGPNPFRSWESAPLLCRDPRYTPNLAHGDFDRDGYRDLVVGHPEFDNGYGRVMVHFGGPGGPEAVHSWEDVGDYATWLGLTTAVLDHDGDGYDDLLYNAGQVDWLTDHGSLFVAYGGPAGLGAPVWLRDGLVTDGTMDVYAVGDIDGDGYAEYSVRTKRYMEEIWEVWSTGPTGESLLWTHVGFETFTAGADLDGDGYSDLIGEYQTGIRSGMRQHLTVYRGGPAGLPATPDWDWSTLAGNQTEEPYVTVGDVTGDGVAELFLGAEWKADSSGALYGWLGGPGAPAASPTWVVGWPNRADRAGLGHAISAGGDFDGDGVGDLAAGAPYTDRTGVDAGSVLLWTGQP